MDNNTQTHDQNINHSIAQKLHRFPKTWLLITVVVVSVSLVVAGVYITKAYQANNENVSTKTVTPVEEPAKNQSQVAETSEELKAIDLAGLKSSINELKVVLSSFSN